MAEASYLGRGLLPSLKLVPAVPKVPAYAIGQAKVWGDEHMRWWHHLGNVIDLLLRLAGCCKEGGSSGLQSSRLHRDLANVRAAMLADLFATCEDADEDEAVRTEFLEKLKSVDTMTHGELESLADKLAVWTRRADAAAMSRARASHVDWIHESQKEHYKGPLRYMKKRALLSEAAVSQSVDGEGARVATETAEREQRTWGSSWGRDAENREALGSMVRRLRDMDDVLDDVDPISLEDLEGAGAGFSEGRYGPGWGCHHS